MTELDLALARGGRNVILILRIVFVLEILCEFFAWNASSATQLPAGCQRVVCKCQQLFAKLKEFDMFLKQKKYVELTLVFVSYVHMF